MDLVVQDLAVRDLAFQDLPVQELVVQDLADLADLAGRTLNRRGADQNHCFFV